jgi:hypothetical protein
MKLRMNFRSMFRSVAFLACAAALVSFFARAADKTSPDSVEVRMTVTASVPDGKRMPEINPADIVVKQGKNRLQVSEWVPAQGERAGLDLFILIDDASDTSLGSQLDDLRNFVKAQAPTTSVGIGYMRNATVQIAQNFTTDREAAAKAIRLPLGTPGAYGSPYLSAIDLMKRWPEHPNRRELLIVTDGVDRARRGPFRHGLGVNPDVDSASAVAQRTGTTIYALYSPGVGRYHRNYWEALNGQMFISKLAEETGGESFYLGLQRPVSFKPYLDSLQKIFDNQYLLSFTAAPGTKAGRRYIRVNTEIAGVELAVADSVWVPAK